MQQTTKYQFKLIEGSDDFSPQPLNDNVEKVEEELVALDAAVNTAQSTADTAQAAASMVHYVIGTYTGSNADITINVGFKPGFLIISGIQMSYNTGRDALASYNILTAGNVLSDFVTFTDTGFVVHQRDSSEYPKLVANRTYDYIAFR